MTDFWKSLGNIFTVAITVLGLVALLIKDLSVPIKLIVLSILLFVGLISLVLYKMNQTENKMNLLEENYIRDNKLLHLESELEALKLIIAEDIKKWIKKDKK